MGVLRRIPGFRSATRGNQIAASLIYVLLIGSCLSVLACRGDEESDSASGATPTAPCGSYRHTCAACYYYCYILSQQLHLSARHWLLLLLCQRLSQHPSPLQLPCLLLFRHQHPLLRPQPLLHRQSQYLPHRRSANSNRNSTLAKGTNITAETLSSSGRLKRY